VMRVRRVSAHQPPRGEGKRGEGGGHVSLARVASKREGKNNEEK
jgi:hypothetical protein